MTVVSALFEGVPRSSRSTRKLFKWVRAFLTGILVEDIASRRTGGFIAASMPSGTSKQVTMFLWPLAELPSFYIRKKVKPMHDLV